jgi:hypothetical protein
LSYEHKQLIYELRELLKKATRALRDAEDLTRLNPDLWPDSIAADRIRSIYEQVNEDVLEGSTARLPLLERLRTTEEALMRAIAALVAIRNHEEHPGSSPPDDEMREIARAALDQLQVT